MSLCNKNCFCVTKYRRDGFTKERLADLRPIFASVCTDFDSALIEFEGEEYDHVHLPVNYPPKVAVSKPVNSLKGISSLMIRKKNGPTSVKNFRAALCGRQVIFQEAAAVRQFPLFASILSNDERYAKLRAKEWNAAPSALTSSP